MSLQVNDQKLVTPIDDSVFTTLVLIPKPFEYDNTLGLPVGSTVKNRTSDNIDVFMRVTQNSVAYKLVLFYPDNAADGFWMVHPDHETAGTTVDFAVNVGRRYKSFAISDALYGCHFGLWITTGDPADIAKAYIVPSRRNYGR